MLFWLSAWLVYIMLPVLPIPYCWNGEQWKQWNHKKTQQEKSIYKRNSELRQRCQLRMITSVKSHSFILESPWQLSIRWNRENNNLLLLLEPTNNKFFVTWWDDVLFYMLCREKRQKKRKRLFLNCLEVKYSNGMNKS